MAYVFKSKAMQAIQAKKTSESSVSATEIAKMRVEIERLKRKVETLTGERGTGTDRAVLKKEFDQTVADFNELISANAP